MGLSDEQHVNAGISHLRLGLTRPWRNWAIRLLRRLGSAASGEWDDEEIRNAIDKAIEAPSPAEELYAKELPPGFYFDSYLGEGLGALRLSSSDMKIADEVDNGMASMLAWSIVKPSLEFLKSRQVNESFSGIGSCAHTLITNSDPEERKAAAEAILRKREAVRNEARLIVETNRGPGAAIPGSELAKEICEELVRLDSELRELKARNE